MEGFPLSRNIGIVWFRLFDFLTLCGRQLTICKQIPPFCLQFETKTPLFTYNRIFQRVLLLLECERKGSVNIIIESVAGIRIGRILRSNICLILIFAILLIKMFTLFFFQSLRAIDSAGIKALFCTNATTYRIIVKPRHIKKHHYFHSTYCITSIEYTYI